MSEHPGFVLPLFALPCLQVFTLQEALQSSRTIPIIRHTRSALCQASLLFPPLSGGKKGPDLPTCFELPTAQHCQLPTAQHTSFLCRTSVSPVLCQMV